LGFSLGLLRFPLANRFESSLFLTRKVFLSPQGRPRKHRVKLSIGHLTVASGLFDVTTTLKPIDRLSASGYYRHQCFRTHIFILCSIEVTHEEVTRSTVIQRL
tara:strand:+ start:2595 stop:2903 length:309 start_codon:yes stop_codon:yes gene_type:complete